MLTHVARVVRLVRIAATVATIVLQIRRNRHGISILVALVLGASRALERPRLALAASGAF